MGELVGGYENGKEGTAVNDDGFTDGCTVGLVEGSKQFRRNPFIIKSLAWDITLRKSYWQ